MPAAFVLPDGGFNVGEVTWLLSSPVQPRLAYQYIMIVRRL